MKKLMSIVFLAMLSHFIYAAGQSHGYEIRGHLVPSDSEHLELLSFVDVTVSHLQDTTLVLYSALTDEQGRFQVKISRDGEYLLKISSLSIFPVSYRISLPDDLDSVSIVQEAVLDLGEIPVRQNVEQIKAAVATEQKQLVFNEVDRMVYSVADDPESKTKNALDILRKIPRVTVDGQDKIEIDGESGFKIYVNGKPSSLFDNNPGKLLKSLPASTIKKMELITEPGAKYDAEGVGGILNIEMNSGTLDGYNLNLNASGGTKYSNVGVYGMVKAGKFFVSAGYSYGASYGPESLFSTSSENLNPEEIPGHISERLHYSESESSSRSRGSNHNASLMASYEIDTLNLLTLSGEFYYGGHRSNSLSSSSVTDILNQPSYSYVQSAQSFGDYGGGSVNLDYQHISRKNPEEFLTFSYRYGYSPNNSASLNELTDRVDYGHYLDYMQNFTQYKNQASLNEHTVQADYTNRLKRMHGLEAGLKYIYRDNHSDGRYLFRDTEDEEWKNDLSRENQNYNSDMHIASAYFSYALNYKQFGMKLGVRDEFSAQFVKYTLFPERNFEALYNDVVPSAMFSWRPAMTQSLNLSYVMRIRRPGIHQLNPFVKQKSPNSISYGNPDLESQKRHSFSLSYSYYSRKVNVNASLGYSFSNNDIMSYNFTNNLGIMVQTYDNIGHSQKASANAYVSYNPVKTSRLYMSLSGYYTMIEAGSMSNENVSGLTSSGFSGYASLGYMQDFKYGFYLNLHGSYYAPSVSLQGKNSSGYYVGLDLTKTFLDDRLSLTLNASNFFGKYMTYRSYMNTDYLKSENISKYPSMSFSLTVSYNFGELNASAKTTRKSIRNDDLMSGGDSGGGK